MKVTNHDLSYNSTKLDYQALLDTARIAYHNSVENVSRGLNRLRDYDFKAITDKTNSSNIGIKSEAEFLASIANQLQIVAETYVTLKEGLKREELEVINKPEIEEE